MFEPDFRVPEAPPIGDKMARKLQSTFKDLSRAVEDLAKDYHDEYQLKQYLQNRWNELFPG
jgi:ATP-dependent protease HslVU (ClpYQ) peptidase subunit